MDRSNPLLQLDSGGSESSTGRAPRRSVRAQRTRRSRRLNRVCRVALCLSLLAQGFLLSGARPAVAQKGSKKKIDTAVGRIELAGGNASQSAPQTAAPGGAQGTPVGSVSTIRATSSAVIDFKALAAAQAKRPKSGKRGASTLSGPAVGVPMPVPGTINDTPEGTVEAPSAPVDQITGPAVTSPTPTQNFLAQEDGPKIGTTTVTIPPDTMGAVGVDKVFTQTNSNFRIHDKTTGAPLSTVNSDTFWAPAGGTGVFDPRVLYDPYNNRWIVAITSNPQTANASIEVGISDTSDPQGTYHLYRFIVGCAAGGISPITGAACNAGGEWADFPMIGFSKGWVGITWNQFTTSTTAFIAGRGIFIDYPNLRNGPASPTAFTVSGFNFCTHPATTLDPNVVNLSLVAHISSGGATYQLVTLSGLPPSLGGTAPSIAATGALTRPGGGWTQPGGDILPQTCTGVPAVTCPTTLRGINANDAFVRSNVIYRNGNLYYPQTVSLPAGTAAAAATSRTAVQWTEINAITGAFVDGGRVDDPTATKTNGGKHYAFGGIAVNKNGDILLGYSQFASNQFASAGYSFRLGGDPAGTMRDPVIFKAGEDYYSKAFGGTQNRWGDYSHAAVDPVNDRDLWTIQEYAGTRTPPDANTTSNNSQWGTWWAKVTAPAGPADLKISEFKLNGIGADQVANTADDPLDEFIEIYNNNSTSLTISAIDGSAGYAVAASDGVIRCTVPNGTVIPARGHYLCVNSGGYSYNSYPAGNGTTATGDATYTADIPINAGIALFNTANAANFSTGTRLDAVGSTSEANTLYREGAGYPPITSFPIDYSFYRDMALTGIPKDTDNNAADFLFVDTNGTSAGAGQRLGAPGPENLSSPANRGGGPIKPAPLDPGTAYSNPPNRDRDSTPDPANNSSLGTLTIRRTFINNTGAPVTRLRFRVVDITTFPSPSGTADLRPRTSVTTTVSTTQGNKSVDGTTLEQPPAQPKGGGFNSTLSDGSVTLASPIPPGGAVNVQFLLGVQQTGFFRFFVIVEALP
jgi:hypothetical protein